jgi:hypothetical protein
VQYGLYDFVQWGQLGAVRRKVQHPGSLRASPLERLMQALIVSIGLVDLIFFIFSNLIWTSIYFVEIIVVAFWGVIG